jgi:hypothetical protein
MGEEVPSLFELAPIAPTFGQRFVKRPPTTARINAKIGRADRKMCNNPGSQGVCREHDVVLGRMSLRAIFAIIDLPYAATVGDPCGDCGDPKVPFDPFVQYFRPDTRRSRRVATLIQP